ncbi:unnamed protein product [Arctia plantaginis]|uniref:Uncharacterized protein n=1 Tax=Arctia plantaginis TaxID=874455 RepID=A0A8S1AP05_ARCPL|nr:unnamed protein product [Arctia plantaginis]
MLRQFDTNYVEDVIIKTRRNGRRSEYVFSIEFTSKHFWANNNVSGRYRMMNLTFNREFPSVWPFEKGKCEHILKLEPSGKDIARGDLVLTFKMLKT